MKAKAKPIKGSARTKKFDRGGTVAALAGLGTLAYLLNKNKKKSMGYNPPEGEYKPQGKFPMEAGDGTSGPGMADTTTKVDAAAKQRAMAASMGRPDMGGGDKAVMESDKDAKLVVKKATTPADKKVTTPADKKATTPADKKATTPADKKATTPADKKATTPASKTTPNMGKSNEARPSKPYPEKKAADNKAAANSSVGEFNRKARAQNLGASYNAQYKALQSAPEGPGKEALKKAVAKAKADYEAAVKGMRRGGAVKKYAAGGSVKASSMGSVRTAKPSMGSASKRGDGIAMRGKTRGKVM